MPSLRVRGGYRCEKLLLLHSVRVTGGAFAEEAQPQRIAPLDRERSMRPVGNLASYATMAQEHHPRLCARRMFVPGIRFQCVLLCVTTLLQSCRHKKSVGFVLVERVVS